MKSVALIGFVLACVAAPSSAETRSYLCLPEVVSMVGDDGSGRLTSEVLAPGRMKFILSNASGDWQVRLHADNLVLFDACVSEFHCERREMFAGVFMREWRDNRFTAMWLSASEADRAMDAYLGKGTCSLI